MDFKLPEIGEGLEEGELIQWLVKVGDSVQGDQALMEVMTDKATVEVPSPTAGVIKEIKAAEGDMIKVGQVVVVIEEGASAQAAPQEEAPDAPAPTEESPAAAPQSSPAAAAKEAPSSGTGIFAEETSPQSSPEGAVSPAGSYKSANENLSPSNAPAAPIVRLMAQKAGVDLSHVSGSGPKVGGVPRILEKDLISFLNDSAPTAPAPSSNGHQQAAAPSAEQAAPAPTPAAAKAPANNTRQVPTYQANGDQGPREERVPLRGLRRVIAQSMAKSKYTAPHYSYVDEFECSQFVEVRQRAKQFAESYGVKISYLPFIVKAVVAALKAYPVVNSSLDESDGKQELVYKKYFNIGIAVATDDGLIVPVIKDADKKSLLQIAQEIAELSEKARTGKASADELRGSTFTITSMGNLGGLFATPIINYPEVGILGVYKIQEKPLVDEGEIKIGKTMTLSLSLDHRVVDGAVGSMFCSAIIDRLKDPAKLMLEMA